MPRARLVRLARLLPIAALLACGAGSSTADSTASVDSGALPVGCTDGDPNQQRYGATCLCCHTDEFGVAGSIDREGAPVTRITVVDAEGHLADMAPNPFGNFFRHLPLTPPLRATAYGPTGAAIAMQSAATSADCNDCHREGGVTAMVHGP
jgi:hypothetical protein